ncbi:MAG: mercury(II) reductase [Anaerolineales bacterium]|nr:mercury(II) reductase [Anaerolineales bacterium]
MTPLEARRQADLSTGHVEKYDLVILGSGSTAFAAALRAAELGKTAVMTENRTLGGTCVNRGCLPSKNLIEAARIVWQAQHPRYPGLRPAKIDFDFQTLIQQKDDVVHDYRDRKYRSIVDEADRIKVLAGHARMAGPHAVEVDGREIIGEQILVATGSRPQVPSIEGIDEIPYLTSDLLTSDEPSELFELPRSLVIVGGGYVALELGQMFHRFGTQVTILERSRRVLKAYEPEVSIAIAQALVDEGIQLVTSASVQRVYQEPDGTIVAVARTRAGEQAIRAQRLLVATGRTPNTDGLGLENVGVGLDDRGFVKVNDYLQTDVPHIWAAGDVVGRHTGSQMATPVGAHDGGIASHNAFSGERRQVDHHVIPRAIFTDPQVAVVGLTDAEANALGHRCWCNTVPVELVPRAGAVHDPRGIAKMVIDDDTRQMLGVSLVMRDAAEVIHEAAMGLRLGATIFDFIDMLHVYPTMAEALKIVAISRFKDPKKLSCCAE